MFENWTPPALAVLGRAVARCPDRVIGLKDLYVAVEDSAKPSIHLPGPTSWSATALLAFERAETAASRSGGEPVGVVCLLAGLIDVGLRTNETSSDQVSVLLLRLFRILGAPLDSAAASDLVRVVQLFDGNLSDMALAPREENHP